MSLERTDHIPNFALTVASDLEKLAEMIIYMGGLIKFEEEPEYHPSESEGAIDQQAMAYDREDD